MLLRSPMAAPSAMLLEAQVAPVLPALAKVAPVDVVEPTVGLVEAGPAADSAPPATTSDAEQEPTKKPVRPKGWGPWNVHAGWWMRPGRGIVMWRFRSPDGKEFNSEESALEHALSLGGADDADEDDDEEEEVDEGEGTGEPAAEEHAAEPAPAAPTILKSHTNTIPPQEGLSNCKTCRSGRGVCRRPGVPGHLARAGVGAQHPARRKKKRAPSAASAAPAAKAARTTASTAAREQRKPQPQPQPSIARSGRVRKAVTRWSDDPLSAVNLGGRQELLTAVQTGAVTSEKEFQLAKEAKVREEAAMFRAEQARVRAEEAEARREATARLEALRKIEEVAVADVKKGLAAKSQEGFDKNRREYVEGITALRRSLGLDAIALPERAAAEEASVATIDAGENDAEEEEEEAAQDMQTEEGDDVAAAAAPADKDSSSGGVEAGGGEEKLITIEGQWLQDMQLKCRQQAGVILMQQQQRLRELELAAAKEAAKRATLAAGGFEYRGVRDKPAPQQRRARRCHPMAGPGACR